MEQRFAGYRGIAAEEKHPWSKPAPSATHPFSSSAGSTAQMDGASSSREGSGFAQGNRDYSQGCLPDPSAPATVPRCCLNADILTARSLPGTRSGVREQQDVLMSFQITIFLSERAFWHHVSPGERTLSLSLQPWLRA